MMNTPKRSWLTFFEKVYLDMDPEQKTAFHGKAGVTPQSIGRWRRQEAEPRRSNLKRILAALPEEKSQKLILLLGDDPKMRTYLPEDIQATLTPLEDGQELLLQQDLLGPFFLQLFRQLLKLERESPEPEWQMSGLILRQALTLLETHPQKTGINLTVCACRPPKDGKTRSLWRRIAMGTDPFRGDLHNETLFLGAESLAGYVASVHHGEMIPDLKNNTSHLPIQLEEGGDAKNIRSIAAYPIKKEGQRIAGVLVAAAKAPDFFTPERLAILEIFADLMRFVFRSESAFIAGDQIALDYMPQLPVQSAYFASFQQRVQQTYEEWRHEDRSMQELTHVKDHVLDLIEKELQQMSTEKSFAS